MIEIIGVTAGIIAVILAIWAVLISIGMIKKEFRVTHPKNGIKQASKQQLKNMFLKLNKNKAFTISSQKDTDLSIHWNIVDKKWMEVLGPAWLKKNYRAWMLLDDDKKMVKYNEQITEKSFTSGSTGAHYETSFFRGIQLWRTEHGYRWGIKTDFTVGEIYNYKFNPNDIKEVIRQIANDQGWSFGLVTTKKQALYTR
ncbi:hypothetical protein J4219_03440 [Candidatus Woesearchaeota archaeon]|nr:hypothetical protein [Candidatus Woesearchaeota archaeon]HLC20386.1 hypothetical protein [Candidatus Nanoarchaeia archaeon]